MSRFVKMKMMVDDAGNVKTSNEHPHKTIFLENVNGKVLKKVLEFCDHYLTEPMTGLPLSAARSPHNNMVELGVQEWYVSFIDVEPPFVDKLYLVGVYMDIEPLLYLVYAAVLVFANNHPGSRWVLGRYSNE
jgi:S-phase kinase-associated protein 1